MKENEIADLSRSAWMLVEHAKNTTTQNITNAVTQGKLKVTKDALPALLAVVAGSIEQGGHQAMLEFQKSIDNLLKKLPKENKKK